VDPFSTKKLSQGASVSKFTTAVMQVLTASVLLVLTVCAAAQQAYPSKPIRLVIPAAPGGGTDILGRLIARKLSQSLGQPVLVENRAGAGGNIATALVAKSAPDGYTLILVNTAFSVVPSLYRNPGFDAERDFAAITHLMISPLLLVAHPSVPVKSVRDLIALAKQRPGELNFASAGIGQSTHLAAELLKSMAKINIVHVPYSGGGPALADVLGGHVTLFFGSMLSTLPHAKSGKLRALGVTSLKRARAIPEVPTISEAALPGFEAVGWYGVLVPAATPKDVINRLSQEFVRSLESTDVRENIIKDGGEPVGGTPDQFAAFIKSELAKWGDVVRVSGAKVD